jgi:pimeloyl-ACP methyl ester carboxylesterase/lysophospholipase L1-like esterase
MRRSISIWTLLILASSGMAGLSQDYTPDVFVLKDAKGKTLSRLPFQLLIPDGAKENPMPLVVSLHGAGERGNDNLVQLRYLPERLARTTERKKYPCYVLAPQCQSGWWGRNSIQAVEKLIEKTVRQYNIDPKRIYLTGFSMGGFATWTLSKMHPEWFAAVVPICGGGDTGDAYRLVGVPIWSIHGAKDPLIPLSFSRNMIAAVKLAGGKPKHTELPGVGHNAWMPAYENKKGVVPWMFKQQRHPESFELGGLTLLAGPKSKLRKKETICFLGDGSFVDREATHCVALIRKGIDTLKPNAKIRVLAQAKGGLTIGEAQTKYLPEILRAKPSIIVIGLGTDELNSEHPTPKKKYEADLRALVDQCIDSGAIVLLLTPGLCGEKPDGANPRDKRLNAYADIHRQVAKKTHAHLLDIRSDLQAYLRFQNPKDKPQGVLTTDGGKLNVAGQRYLAQRIATVLAETLWAER